jgi:hypothetical protein
LNDQSRTKCQSATNPHSPRPNQESRAHVNQCILWTLPLHHKILCLMQLDSSDSITLKISIKRLPSSVIEAGFVKRLAVILDEPPAKIGSGTLPGLVFRL